MPTSLAFSPVNAIEILTTTLTPSGLQQSTEICTPSEKFLQSYPRNGGKLSVDLKISPWPHPLSAYLYPVENQPGGSISYSRYAPDAFECGINSANFPKFVAILKDIATPCHQVTIFLPLRADIPPTTALDIITDIRNRVPADVRGLERNYRLCEELMTRYDTSTCCLNELMSPCRPESDIYVSLENLRTKPPAITDLFSI